MDYRCQIYGTFFDGTPWSTRFHQTSAESEAALWTTFAEAVTDMWSNATYGIDMFYPTGTTITAVSVAALNGVMHEDTKTKELLPLPGTSSEDTLPFLNATVIKLSSSGTHRYQRGRMYLPALAETFVNDNILTEAAGLRISTAVNAMFNSQRAAGGTIFVYNAKETTKPPLIPPFTKQTITQEECSNKPARQSRRARKQVPIYY